MAIPTGTKFQGIASPVDTENKGSSQVNAMRDVYTIEEIRTSAGTDSVYDNLVAQGTDETTTAVMEYGVNVFRTATATDYCAKLPQPVTGKSTKIVNMTSQVLVLYPSNIGGQINNLAVDTPVSIPPDGVSYEFTCIENPLPGAWTWTPPASNQVELGEMSIAHINGVASNFHGTDTAFVFPSPENTLSFNGLISFNNPTEYKSLAFPARGLKSKIYTNIVAGDIPSGYAVCERIVNFINTPSSLSSVGAVDYVRFPAATGVIGNNTVIEVTSGTLSTPPEVGDNNTFYTESMVNPNILTSQLGTGGIYSSYFWIYAINIPASAATKTYKFKIFVEYV